MKHIETPVILATGYMIIYNLLPFWGYSDDLIIALFIFSPFVLVWLAITILKKGEPSNKEWDEFFYEDFSYRRNGKEELCP